VLEHEHPCPVAVRKMTSPVDCLGTSLVPPDPKLSGLVFRIQGASLGCVWFDDTFLEQTEPHETAELLRSENLAARMRKVVKGKMVRVISDGVKEPTTD
jgi:hypothetical protein